MLEASKSCIFANISVLVFTNAATIFVLSFGCLHQRLTLQAKIQPLKIYMCVFFPLKVSFVAHIAGGLAGMSVGYVIFSNFDKNFIKDPRFWICISAFLIFVVLAVLFNVFFSPANQ